MGWTCVRGTREHVVNGFARDHGTDKRGFFILKKKWDGWNRLWMLCETRRPGEMEDEATQVSRFIMLVLLKSYPAHGEWCYKDISDDMGPCETSAPLSWLDEVTLDRKDGYAYAWYQKVREFHAKRGTGNKLNKGQSIKLKNGIQGKIFTVSPLVCELNGQLFKIKRQSIDWSSSAST